MPSDHGFPTTNIQAPNDRTMNNPISRFYEDVSSGNIDGAKESIQRIQALKAPPSLISSLHFVLDSYLPQDNHTRRIKSPGGYFNRRVARAVNEKAPSTRPELCPLISIIIVSFNSSRELKELLPSLAEQTYKNFEVILVENGGEDNEELLKELDNEYTYIKTASNVGYAEGNNIGASRSSGEYLLLLNPDTRLDPNSIRELLFSLTKKSNQALAASPKIYFFRDFVRIFIKNLHACCRLSYSDIVKDLSYTKLFIRQGLTSGCGSYIQPDRDGCICLDVPAPQKNEIISLATSFASDFSDAKVADLTKAEVYIGNLSEAIGLIDVGIPFKITGGSKIDSIARRLINNAGSGINKSGIPYDRGFADEDREDYSRLTHVDAFCGCCVLLHRLTWVARRLFFADFFAYFEDTELSHWIKLHNYQIVYCPASMVYHRHSEATKEKSPNWEFLVSRSRTLYKWVTGRIIDTEYAQQMIEQLSTVDVSKDLLDTVEKLYPSSSLANRRRGQQRETVTVAVYNSYWNTFGGGEKHALDIASMISQSERHEVYLISDRDFNKDQLASYFDIDLSRCRSMRLDEVSPLTTAFFDIFINSTYRSLLLPRAGRNYYVVSFPTKEMPEQLVDRYIFLHNSKFTQQWATVYWGQHDSIVVNPVLACKAEAITDEKTKTIISIGRFNYTGHCKNQHLLLAAFYRAKELGLLEQDWSLILAGSVNRADQSSVSHYEDCKALIRDETVSLIANAKRDDIVRLYENSFAYLHGTGIDVDAEKSPELCEHFGISVFEAITHGCIPIVHDSGGARDILQYTTNGMRFTDTSDLTGCFGQLDRLYSEYRNSSEVEYFNKVVEGVQQAINAARSEFQKIVDDE